MLRWSAEQRRILADKLPDAANVALGALVFGQFIGERPFSAAIAVVGVVAWAAFLGAALSLGRGTRE